MKPRSGKGVNLPLISMGQFVTVKGVGLGRTTVVHSATSNDSAFNGLSAEQGVQVVPKGASDVPYFLWADSIADQTYTTGTPINPPPWCFLRRGTTAAPHRSSTGSRGCLQVWGSTPKAAP